MRSSRCFRLSRWPTRPCLAAPRLSAAQPRTITSEHPGGDGAGSTGSTRSHKTPPSNGEARMQRQASELVAAHLPRRLHGSHAIVTGGSRGIGWSIASRLAREGVSCTLVGRNCVTLEAAVEALPRPAQRAPRQLEDEAVTESKPAPAEAGEAAPDGPLAQTEETEPFHNYLVGDVCDPLFWRTVFRKERDTRFLINAAGIAQNANLAAMRAEAIRAVLDTNLYGTTLGCHAAMRAWIKNRGSDKCIVNISSLLAVRGGAGATAYAAAKAGIIGLTRALADEGKSRRVRANVVLPGYIFSDMTKGMPSTQYQELMQRIPAGRIGSASEVADAVMFLAKNRYANNCVLNLDGGLSAVV